VKEKLAALTIALLAGSTASNAQTAGDDIFVDSFDTVLTCDGPSGYSRLEMANMTYGAVDSYYRLGVDVTEWDNIFGHGTSTDGLTPWPGVRGSSPVAHTLSRDGFMSIHFYTGDSPAGRFGWMIYPSNSGNGSPVDPPDIQAKISRSCGDFAPPALGEQTACFKQRAYSDDTRFMSWMVGDGINTSLCYLAPNTHYWVNIKGYDPNQPVRTWPIMLLSQWGGN